MAEQGIRFEQRVSVPAHVLFRELDGEAVMLNLEDESYFGLDAVGTRMWVVLEGSPTIGEAHKKLLAEYEVDGEQLANDMIELVQALQEQGLVVVE